MRVDWIMSFDEEQRRERKKRCVRSVSNVTIITIMVSWMYSKNVMIFVRFLLKKENSRVYVCVCERHMTRLNQLSEGNMLRRQRKVFSICRCSKSQTFQSFIFFLDLFDCLNIRSTKSSNDIDKSLDLLSFLCF